MKSAKKHPRESERLAELFKYEVMDSEDEAVFDQLTEMSSVIFETDICLISLVDGERQWFKSKHGLSASETSKEIAFCSHAILQKEVFEIQDARKDERFHDNPLVTGDPNIRFYAGAPLISDKGLPLGTLCVIDSKPHTLSADKKNALKVLADQVISQLELRLQNRRLKRINQQREQLLALIAHDLRSPFSSILGFSKRLRKKAGTESPENIAKMADAILTSGHVVFQLLDELLQWSQLQMGAISCQLEALELLPLVSINKTLLQETFDVKNIDLVLNIDNNVMVKGDKTLISAVIRNLLANAAKYTPIDGKITIVAEDVDGMVQVSIADTGEGISDQQMDACFSSPVDSQVGTEGEQGFGLGLNLCQDFIERQNGRIWFDKDYQQGTKVVFSLPNALDSRD
jgi:signal transduction histidine kinase